MKFNSVRTILCAIALFTVMAGCVKEVEQPIDVEENLHEVIFHAGWDAETKTVLQEDGQVFWSPGDEISLFIGDGENGGYKLTSTNTEPAAKADFVGQIGENKLDSKYIAVYPFNPNSFVYGGNCLVTEVPSVQYATAGSFSQNQLISVAMSDNDHLYFRNICGGIKFSVVNEGIQKVVFTSRRFYSTKYPISGQIYVSDIDLSTDYIFPYDTDAHVDEYGSSKITVYPSEGKYFKPGECYYVSMIPGELPFLEVSYYKEKSVATYSCSTSSIFGNWTAEIKRSNVKRLLDKDKDLEFVDIEHTYALLGYDMWYIEEDENKVVDFSTITEVNFHTLCSSPDGKLLRSSVGHENYYPVYGKRNGTIVDFYTEAERYMVEANMPGSSSPLSFTGMKVKELDLSMIDTRNITEMYMMFTDCEYLEKVNLSSFNTSNVTDMGHMFYNCRRLEHLDLSSFRTPNLAGMYNMFGHCSNLRTIDLSNADSGKMQNSANAGELFYGCKWLTKVDLGNLDLSNANCEKAMLRFAVCSNNCAISCTPGTKARLCHEDTNLVNEDDIVSWYSPGDVLPDLEPKQKPGLYYSSDFSMDSKSKILNKATKGAGIDILLLGESYSDRLIENGTYEDDMISTMDAIFSVEPMKSYKEFFNVYMIYAVSVNEVYGENTAFDYYNSDLYDPESRYGEHGLTAEIDYLTLNSYTSPFVDKNTKHLTRVIVVNDNRREGWAMMHPLCDTEDEVAHDCPTGIDGIAVVHKCEDAALFTNIVCHEFGHAFAALFEEYVDRMWSIPDDGFSTDHKQYMQRTQNQHGWWNNVDFTSNPSNIRWHSFLEDSRYDESHVSILEGARYAYDIWRSADGTIMSSSGDQYSVPSREAIYKVINKLAYGDSWQYDYETFVQQDLKNIQPAAGTASVKSVPFPAKVNRKPLFKMEESTTPDGKKMITVIMD